MMLTSLCDMGLDPLLWNLHLVDMYGMVTSRVCIRGEGILQYCEISTEVFKAKETPFLRSVLQDWQYLYWYPNSSGRQLYDLKYPHGGHRRNC
jgi:hypothetical protein